MNEVQVGDQVLLAILDVVPAPLLVLDAEFRVTHANQSFYETFRLTHETTIGEWLFALGGGHWDTPALRALLGGSLAGEQPHDDVEVHVVLPAIGAKTMLLTARQVAHHPDGPGVTVLTIDDVTERRRMERRLAAKQRELERSNAALREFAFVASHDLQEPLRKILSFGERLGTSAGPLLEGNPRQYLERMLDAATRMRTLITDLLAYSQVAASATPFLATDLGAIAREVVGDLETSIAAASGRVDVGDLPVIDADPPQMRQLLQNLMTNALKFRRPDSAPVVRVRAAGPTDSVWTITVTDNGIGFDQAHAEKIFRMFERLHARGRYEGSGMGLAICRKIVERHGGTIAATSTAGQGTTLSVTLPVTQAEVEYVP